MHEIGQSAAKSYAYLLGVYLGDGCVSKSGFYSQTTIDKDFSEAVVNAFGHLTTKRVTVTYLEKPKKGCNCSPHWAIMCYDSKLSKQFVSDTKGKMVIPEYVFAWDGELKKQFIVGLMDSEGFVARNHSHRGYDWAQTNRSYYMGYKSCDVWINELIAIMESVGLRLGKLGVEKPRKEGYKTPRRFHIKMQSWVDAGLKFNIARKQNRVDEWASIGPYERRALHPRNGPQRFCSEDGCKNKHLARGLCNMHYKQAQAKLRDYTPDIAVRPA